MTNDQYGPEEPLARRPPNWLQRAELRLEKRTSSPGQSSGDTSALFWD